MPSNISLHLDNGEDSLKALILAGGFGTRLRPLSCTRPKILFPIVNKPFLQWTFERLSKNKIEKVILAVNLQNKVLIEQSRIRKYGLKVAYSQDPLKKPLGTGGPTKKAEKLLGSDTPFLVLNGDIFTDLLYTELFKAHDDWGSTATIALHRVEDPSRYGVAEIVNDHLISRFTEKPQPEAASTNLINAGVYVLSPEIFEYIPEGRKVSLEREVFPQLARQGKLHGYIFEGLWVDIGKLEDYLKINKILLESTPYQKENNVGNDVKIMKPIAFAKRVSIKEKSVIGPYVVLGQNTTVGKNVHIQDSVIFPGTIISDSSSIDGAIIGENVVIGKGVRISEGCVLGDHVRVEDNVSLERGVSVCPAAEISQTWHEKSGIKVMR